MATQCPNCNAYNHTTATVCKKCGAELNVKKAVEEAPVSKAPWWKRVFSKK